MTMLRKEANERIAVLKAEYDMLDEDLDNIDADEQGSAWNRARGQYDAWRRVLAVLATVCLLSLSAFAQFTLVTGTITDPSGIPYAFGTISPTLNTPGGGIVTLNGQP